MILDIEYELITKLYHLNSLYNRDQWNYVTYLLLFKHQLFLHIISVTTRSDFRHYLYLVLYHTLLYLNLIIKLNHILY